MAIRVVGKIIGYHGIKGEIKIHPLLNDLADFYDFDFLIIAEQKYTVESVRSHKDKILLKLEAIDNRDQAELLQGYIQADLEEELVEGEIYIADLLQSEVYDIQGDLIGRVSNFADQAQGLLFIKAIPQLQCKNEILVPFVKEYIKAVDAEAKKITVDISQDLIDLAR